MTQIRKPSKSVVLIGYGYWGTNLARAIQNTAGLSLDAIVEQDEGRRTKALGLYDCALHPSCSELQDSQAKFDFGVIATRPASHLELTLKLLEMGLNVLLAKPAGINKSQCMAIQEASEGFGLQVFVDFTYLYSAPIQMLEEWQNNHNLGRLMNYVSYRTSLGIVQSDVDVLADLLSHDLSVLLSKKVDLPSSVECIQTDISGLPKVNGAAIKLIWDDSFTAFIHVSWLSPIKVRLMQFNYENGSIVIQEQNPNEPVSIIMHDMFNMKKTNGPDDYLKNISFTIGDQIKPRVALKEPLSDQFQKLMRQDKVLENEIPGTISLAVKVWKVIEATRESILKSCKVPIR